MLRFLCLFAVISALAGCTQQPETAPNSTQKPTNNRAYFDHFYYAGNDEIFRAPLAPQQYQNPILAGYHPDPSVVQVGDDYYMVNSTFGFFPGIPIFHSRDLVNWRQLGNVVHRPDQLNFDGLHLGQNGVYAPAIEYKDGTFYVVNTCVACGGNFVMTATDPAGPWSDPIWIRHVPGIDPSIFFDDDGKTYIVHHGNPEKPKYPAHTALYVMEVDPASFEALSEDVMLVDGAEEAPWHTEYIEGPHIYKVDGTYYLSAPGGGTGFYHGQLIYKSDHVFGPYTPNPNNPILTQVELPHDRENPVTATGHADMFQDPNGDWWAVFLGTRVYNLTEENKDPGLFHTGRETFMLPVAWKDGWPHILNKDEAVPHRVNKPNLPSALLSSRPTTGNFIAHEEFTQNELGPEWLFIRTPNEKWWDIQTGTLSLSPRADTIGAKAQPSFIGRRLAHMKASYSTKVQFAPQNPQQEAGLLSLQNDQFYYTFGLSRNPANELVLRIRKRAGDEENANGKTLAEVKIESTAKTGVHLKMEIDKAQLNFLYSLDGTHYTPVLQQQDASVLTTAKAGGFTGAVVGMYAQGE